MHHPVVRMKDIARASPADLPERRDFSKEDKEPVLGAFQVKTTEKEIFSTK